MNLLWFKQKLQCSTERRRKPTEPTSHHMKQRGSTRNKNNWIILIKNSLSQVVWLTANEAGKNSPALSSFDLFWVLSRSKKGRILHSSALIHSRIKWRGSKNVSHVLERCTTAAERRAIPFSSDYMLPTVLSIVSTKEWAKKMKYSTCLAKKLSRRLPSFRVCRFSIAFSPFGHFSLLWNVEAAVCVEAVFSSKAKILSLRC